MNDLVAVSRGASELRRLLDEQTLDLRTLDLAGFRRWLSSHLERWRNNPVFVERGRIRDLRRAHPALRKLEREQRRAVEADEASPAFSRLHELERELTGAGKAIRGLSEALIRVDAEKQQSLWQKRDAFLVRQQALCEEMVRLIEGSAERQTLLRIAAELRQLRSSIGLEQEEARLAALLKQQGQHSGRAGKSFEKVTLDLTWRLILPLLLADDPHPEEPGLRVLHGVTLGAARTEFDQVIIRLPERAGEPVELLGIVEAKRNINDLAHGFRLRQENLAWFTGTTAKYDPPLYRTRQFPTGHFDRAAVHHQEGETYVFAPVSFRHFRPGPARGLLLDRLWFITRAGTLWGVSAEALSRITYRIATDEDWQPESDSYLEGLLKWCRSLAEPVETPDVLRLYAETPGLEEQILVVGR